MKEAASLFTILTLILIPRILPAQHDRPDHQIAIMATAVHSSELNSIPVSVIFTKQPETESIEISSFSDEGGVIMITGRPYSEFEFRIPSEAMVVNQHGEEAQLRDVQMLKGPDRSPDLMEVVSPSLCVESTIPASGHLFIQVGGTVASDLALRGRYSGSLNLECEAGRDE